MMYHNKLAVAIKSNGKILREDKDLVKLPFGSEFTVFVKNLESRRVKFKLEIDGQDVLGTEIVVNANSETEIRRFIRNGNMEDGNAFKFIERTKSIEDGPRGVKIDDGIVRVEFWFEQPAPIIQHAVYYAESMPQQPSTWNTTFGGSTSSIATNSILCGNSLMRTASSANLSAQSTYVKPTSITNDIGITVPGSKVDQKFTTVYGFNSETVSHVIVLRMAGMVGLVEVTAPVTVAYKPKCVTCGKLNKSNSKFCSDCGTVLVLL